MRLGIDLDGCLCDFNSAYCDLIVKTTNLDLFEDGWRSKMNVTWPTTWFYPEKVGYDKAVISKIWTDVIMKAENEFWFSLNPLPYAIETIQVLDDLSKHGHEIFFMTHRPGSGAQYQSQRWLKALGMEYPTVIVSNDKVDLAHDLKINMFIDDKLDTTRNMSDYAEDWHAKEFPAKGHIYLLAAPWNVEGRSINDGIVVASVAEMLQKEGLWRS